MFIKVVKKRIATGCNPRDDEIIPWLSMNNDVKFIDIRFIYN